MPDRHSALAVFAFCGVLCAQAPPSVRLIGEAVELAPATGRFSIKTDRGDVVTVATSPATAYYKVPPGTQNLSSGTRIDFSGIGVGDRVLAIGQQPSGPLSLEARSVIVMSRADLDKKRQAEQEEWRRRSASGIVLALDANGKSITMKAGSRTVTIELIASTRYWRYAPASVKFSDALPGSAADIRAGDVIQVLGERSADGATIAAERIVSGTFRQIAASVTSVNAEAGELVVMDLASRKALSVRVTSDSTMKRLPPALAASLARRYRLGASSADAGNGEDVGLALDRLPAMPFSGLKAGDAILLSCAGSDPARVTAFMLLAGAEPLLAASPTAARDILGGWNLSGLEGPQ